MADLSAYDPIFKAAGDEWNVDPRLLKAIATQESGGNARAVSKAGAQGLMQIIPDTQRYLGVTDPNDPVQSIYGAAKYINEALEKEGTAEGALLYYHGGPGWRQAYGPESKAYVPAVTSHYVKLAPTSGADEAQPTAPTGPLIIGDSLASKKGLGGTGVVGAQPKAVLDSITGLPDDQVKGRDVVLSSGASNNPAQAGLVEQQIKTLKDRGANTVTVVGVGDHPKLAGINDTLAAIATKNDARFVAVPADQLSPDRIHPTAQGYRTLLAAATPRTATDATPASTPAPAGPTGAGNAMPKDDPLSLLPPAPKATGAAAPASSDDPLSLLPPAPKGTETKPAEAPWRSQSDRLRDLPQGPPVLPDAIGRIGQAAAEGWQGIPAIPRVPTDLVMAPIYNPLLAGVETAFRAGGAVLRGGQQAVVEATPNISLPSLPPGVQIPLGGGRFLSGELTPGPLGREIAAMPEAFPTGTNVLRPPVRPAIPEAPPPGPRFVQEYFGEGTASNPLAAAPPGERPAFVPPGTNIPPRPVEPPAFIPPNEASPVPRIAQPEAAPAEAPPAAHTAPVGPDKPWLGGLKNSIDQVVRENAEAGGPTSLGAAATPEELARLTPAQVKAYRRMSELNQIVSPAAREADWQIHVEGSHPTLAEGSADPKISQAETVLRSRKPNEFGSVLDESSQARIRSFDEHAGTDIQLADLDAAQKKQAGIDTAAIERHMKPADLKPAADWMDNFLNDPRIQENPEMMAVMKPLRDALYNSDGTIKTDPQQVWGMHDNLRNKLEKAKDRTSTERFAIAQLNDFKKVVDGVMNAATDDHFQTFLDNYGNYAQQKNGLKVLQDFRTKLVDQKTGHVRADQFHRWLIDLAVRRGKPGIDAAMDIPDSTMQALIAIDTDLKRAANIDLGKMRGSGTNLFFEVANALGIAGAHALVGATGMSHGGIGNVFLQQGINVAEQKMAGWRLNALTRKHLSPPPGGYHPFNNPNAPP